MRRVVRDPRRLELDPDVEGVDGRVGRQVRQVGRDADPSRLALPLDLQQRVQQACRLEVFGPRVV